MKRPSVSFSLVFLACLSLSGCGQSGERPAQQVDSGEHTTSSLAEPPPQSARVTPSTHPPGLTETNPNSQDQDLGSLCWARWDVVRTLVKGYGGGQAAAMAVDLFSQRVAGIRAHAAQIRDGVPEQYREFVDRLLRDLDAARQELEASAGESPEARFTRISGSFDFESYPGIRDYIENAPDDPECKMP